MDDPRLLRRIRKKERAGFALAALVTSLYFGFVSVMAFRPEWLAGTSSREGHVSVALVSTLGILVVTLAMMGAFAKWRSSHLAEEAKEIASGSED